MRHVRRILFPTDFSTCADHALSWALLLARRWEAELHLFHAVVLHEHDPHNPAHHLPDAGEIVAHLQRTAATAMRAELENRGVAGIEIVHAHERAPLPAPAILEYAADHGVDLVVMGTHGRRGLGHLLLGSVTEEVVRKAPCPVLTVRPDGHDEQAEVALPSRVLAAVDFSEHSPAVVGAARFVAGSGDAELSLLHVVEEQIHPAFYAVGRTSLLELHPEIRDTSVREMRRLLGDDGADVADVSTNVVEGRPAVEIVRFAEDHGSELVVVGSRGLTGVEHALLGSVADRVIRTAPCPVLVAREAGRG